MRTTVVIPSRNEGDSVVDLATAVLACCDDVIVVDGHSTDGSPERLKALGVAVIEDGGLGKGDAIRRGLAAATGDVIVTMDADGSHDPADVRSLGSADRGRRGGPRHRVPHARRQRRVCRHVDDVRAPLGQRSHPGHQHRFGTALADSQNRFTRFARAPSGRWP